MGMPLLIAAACTQAAPPAASTPPRAAGTAATGRVKLPTYSPIQVAKPDLPATDAGLDAAYFEFPRNPVKSVPQPPGSGQDVNVFTLLQIQPPPPVDQNAAW